MLRSLQTSSPLTYTRAMSLIRKSLRSSIPKEPVNKSSVFSAGHIAARCAKDRAVKCLDLFKRSDKADGRYRARPSGLSERVDLGVSDFRQTTSLSAIAALISNRSKNQRRKGLVHRFPNKTCLLAMLVAASCLDSGRVFARIDYKHETSNRLVAITEARGTCDSDRYARFPGQKWSVLTMAGETSYKGPADSGRSFLSKPIESWEAALCKSSQLSVKLLLRQ